MKLVPPKDLESIIHPNTSHWEYYTYMSQSSFTQEQYKHECTWDIDIENFQTLYNTKALQLKHNIVIAMSLNYPTIGEIKEDLLTWAYTNTYISAQKPWRIFASCTNFQTLNMKKIKNHDTLSFHEINMY